MAVVEICDYDPAWKDWYLAVQDYIWPHVSEYAVEMLHVGSTSINGMMEKPILDIDIVVEDFSQLDDIITALAGLGYNHVGNYGIVGREAFKRDALYLFPHHLYVCQKDSVALQNHLLLKKHLENNAEAFEKYKTLKQSLACSAGTIDSYCIQKTEFILSCLEAEGVAEKDIADIRRQNTE